MSPVYIARSKQVAARMLDGEMMIMSAHDSTLFSLNRRLGHLAGADGARRWRRSSSGVCARV